MRISELGEFALIEQLKRIVHVERSDIVVGIDDDTAVLDYQQDELVLATVDCQIDQVHFLSFLSSAAQIGRRALVVNLSDIAAMGGQPQFALVSLGLPSETHVGWIEACYRGLRAEADQWGLVVVGGNITKSPVSLWIDITVLGRVRREHLLLRSGAQVGDKILVTGDIGDAYAGLKLVLNPRLRIESFVREKLIQQYIEPVPKLKEAAVIAQSGYATAMIDVSDGLSGDVGHICDQSKVGLRIWTTALPISPETRSVAEAMQIPAWQIALEGGDDYGLCFTVRPEAVDELQHAIMQEIGTKTTVIGEIIPFEEGRRLILPDGQDVPLNIQAWQHFGASNMES